MNVDYDCNWCIEQRHDFVEWLISELPSIAVVIRCNNFDSALDLAMLLQSKEDSRIERVQIMGRFIRLEVKSPAMLFFGTEINIKSKD